MQVYINDCKKDFKSRFLKLLCEYLEIQPRKLGLMIPVHENTKKVLSFPELPLYIPSPELVDEKSVNGCEIAVAKAICKETCQDGFFFGISQEDKNKNDFFLEHITKDLKYDAKKLIPELNENLKFSTYINDKYIISILDLFCFALVVPELNQFTDEEKDKFCNVSRWANYIQSLPGISDACKKIGLRFNLPIKLFLLDINELNKQSANEAPATKKEESEKEKGKESKMDKKEKAKEKKEKAKEKANNEKKEELHLMSKVDIRVGKIVSIEPNKEGDKLFNEQIDIGNGEVRKIASGLNGRVDINDLKDSLVVVICNLKPRNLKGWPSHGMILCTSNTEGKVEPLRPPKDSQPGDLVFIGDLPREPVPDKKCPWDKICDKIFVNEKNATYKDDKDEFIWHTEKGNIISPTMDKGTIS